jgi:hypothetical protein
MFFPFGERIAVNEPCPSLALPRRAGDVVIFPWIWGREPAKNIFPQFVTCQTIRMILGSNGSVKEY